MDIEELIDDADRRNHRIDALQDNAAWLQEHNLDEHHAEACKRLGTMQGDINALLSDLAGEKD